MNGIRIQGAVNCQFAELHHGVTLCMECLLVLIITAPTLHNRKCLHSYQSYGNQLPSGNSALEYSFKQTVNNKATTILIRFTIKLTYWFYKVHQIPNTPEKLCLTYCQTVDSPTHSCLFRLLNLRPKTGSLYNRNLLVHLLETGKWKSCLKLYMALRMGRKAAGPVCCVM